MTRLQALSLIGMCASAVPLMGVINRIRGGMFWQVFGQGAKSTRLWAALMAFALASFMLGLIPGFCWALGYLIWAYAPHGRWFDLGRWPLPQRDATWFERGVEWLFPRNDFACLAFSCAVALLPMAALMGFEYSFLGLAIALAYKAGWEIEPKGGTGLGEWFTGFCFGTLLLVDGFFSVITEDHPWQPAYFLQSWWPALSRPVTQLILSI